MKICNIVIALELLKNFPSPCLLGLVVSWMNIMSAGVKLYQSYPKCPEAAVRDVASSREAASLTVCKFYKNDPLHRFLFYVSNNLRAPYKEYL